MTYLDKMDEHLTADSLVSVNISDIFDVRFADHVLLGRRRDDEHPELAACGRGGRRQRR